MFLRITHGRLQPGSWSGFEAGYVSVVQEVTEPIAGLQGRLLARDVDRGDCGYTLSVWDSLEAMRQYEWNVTSLQEHAQNLRNVVRG